MKYEALSWATGPAHYHSDPKKLYVRLSFQLLHLMISYCFFNFSSVPSDLPGLNSQSFFLVRVAIAIFHQFFIYRTMCTSSNVSLNRFLFILQAKYFIFSFLQLRRAIDILVIQHFLNLSEILIFRKPNAFLTPFHQQNRPILSILVSISIALFLSTCVSTA